MSDEQQRPLLEDPEERRMLSLRGQFRHYCPEWDYMAIDEKCPEFEACSCYEEQTGVSRSGKTR